jgi:ankyrin repeat protein
MQANIEAQAENKQTPLHAAAKAGDIENILKLIKSGAKIEARDKDGRTPLHLATTTNIAAVKALIQNNAKIFAKDNCGNTPLNLAEKLYCSYNQFDNNIFFMWRSPLMEIIDLDGIIWML